RVSIFNCQLPTPSSQFRTLSRVTKYRLRTGNRNSMATAIRSAARSLARTPGLTVAIVLILAFAIAANAALLSVANALVWNTLPYNEPGQLVVVSEARPEVHGRALVSPADYADWIAASRTLRAWAAYRPWGFVLTGRGDAERLRGARV